MVIVGCLPALRVRGGRPAKCVLLNVTRDFAGDVGLGGPSCDGLDSAVFGGSEGNGNSSSSLGCCQEGNSDRFNLSVNVNLNLFFPAPSLLSGVFSSPTSIMRRDMVCVPECNVCGEGGGFWQSIFKAEGLNYRNEEGTCGVDLRKGVGRRVVVAYVGRGRRRRPDEQDEGEEHNWQLQW